MAFLVLVCLTYEPRWKLDLHKYRGQVERDAFASLEAANTQSKPEVSTGSTLAHSVLLVTGRQPARRSG